MQHFLIFFSPISLSLKATSANFILSKQDAFTLLKTTFSKVISFETCRFKKELNEIFHPLYLRSNLIPKPITRQLVGKFYYCVAKEHRCLRQQLLF